MTLRDFLKVAKNLKIQLAVGNTTGWFTIDSRSEKILKDEILSMTITEISQACEDIYVYCGRKES